jgi:succinate-semialdehyde dehydrogenase/glutarate-semialdehyde dehydrogenase
VTADLAALTGMDVPTGLFIGGEWTTNGRTIGVTNPATEDTLVEIADATPDDALAAVAAAHEALPGWAATPPRERAECLRKAWALMIERSEAIARLMVLENGKALRDARGEVTYAAEFFRWYAEEGQRAGHAVELPGGHGDPQDRPRAGGGLHRGAQAGQGDPAVRVRGRGHPA